METPPSTSSSSSSLSEIVTEVDTESCPGFVPSEECSSALSKRIIPDTPFELDSILEVLFGFLQVDSLKNCRMVNSLWKAEATKKLLEKSYIRVPPEFYQLSKRRRRAYKDCIRSLLCECSSLNPVTPEDLNISRRHRISPRHLLINNLRDLQLIQSMFREDFVFWLEVQSMKLADSCGIPSSTELTQLLRKTPNLAFFDNQYIFNAFNDPSEWDLEYIEPFLRAGRADLVKYYSFDMDLRMEPPDRDTLDYFETFSRENTKLKALTILMYGAHEADWVADLFQLWPRLGSSLTRIFESSQETLEEISLCHEISYVRGLRYFPLVNLTRVTFYLTSGMAQPMSNLQFSLHFPNLVGCTIQIDGVDEIYQPELWNEVFKGAGQSTSATELEIYSCDIDIASVARTFPAVTKLELVNLMDIYTTLGRSVWDCYRAIQTLELNLMSSYPENVFPYIDASITGFSVETIKRLDLEGDKSTSQDNDDKDDDVKVEPEFPSLLQLTELTYMHIHFNCGRMRELPRSFKLMSWICGKYVFQKMKPKLKVKLSVSAREPALRKQFEATLQPLKVKGYCDLGSE